MANLLDTYGLSGLAEDEVGFENLLKYIASEGKPFMGYYGAPYFYLQAGRAELWVATEKTDDGHLGLTSFHTHCSGNHMWEMIVSGIDLSPKSLSKTERFLMMNRSTDNGGLLPVDIFNADVLPSFLKGDRLKLQVVASCLEIGYYSSVEEFNDTLPRDKRGKKWSLANGSLFPLSFLGNHQIDRYEEGEEYTNDIDVHFRATVKALYFGTFSLGDETFNSFIRCVADTQFGELEFHHSIEQVPEEMRENIRVGAVIAGTCIISADAAVGEYGNGMIKDFDHDLKLLRYTVEKGAAERLRSVLSETAVYKTATSGKSYFGPDEIIARFDHVHEHHKGTYIAHMAEITETDADGMDYPVGTRCLVLADNEEDNYESIMFIDTDEDGEITRITVETDSRYHFRIERPERVKTPLDDIDPPGSVLEPIAARAKFHGFLDVDTEYEEISDDPDYAEHASNARRMLDALRSDPQPDALEAIGNILAYLFAKAVESTRNRQREYHETETKLLASYSPYDALRGRLFSSLPPKENEALKDEMEPASQFARDLFFFMQSNDKTEDDFEETFTQAAVAVQSIGRIYALNGFAERLKSGDDASDRAT